MILKFFFLFLLQKDFDICLRPFFVFCLFLLQKDFDIFHVQAFICVFDNSKLGFLYIEKKTYKKIFLLVFYMFKNQLYGMSYVNYMNYVCRLYELYELCKL